MMIPGAHIFIQCHYCGGFLMLPQHCLLHLDEVPEDNYYPAPAVAVPCRHCKRMRFVVPNDVVVSQKVVGSNPLETVWLDVWLKCEGPACHFRAPVYAQWLPSITAEEQRADIETWSWDGLHCAHGHAILNPGYEWKTSPELCPNVDQGSEFHVPDQV